MTLAGRDGLIINAPATALDVFDVSGAGDTVAATLLAGAAGGLELEDAVYMANRAAGIVVGKVGTYPVHRDELLKDLLAEQRKDGYGYRTLSWQEIESLANTWRACGGKNWFLPTAALIFCMSGMFRIWSRRHELKSGDCELIRSSFDSSFFKKCCHLFPQFFDWPF